MSQYAFGHNSGDVTIWQRLFGAEGLQLTKNKWG
jgi:hypothetical protein